MTNLSPATQAIIDASNCAGSRCVQLHIADALRAAADQLMPLTKTPWGSTLIPILTAEESRNGLLAIAAELEA
jgi:hypothetical protein